jgi:hypothetical protein
MTRHPANVSASVKQRLLNLARERQEEFNLLLTRYGSERLLHRLGESVHAREFILKGAMLFHLWSEISHRPTRDVDLLGSGAPDPDRLASVLRDICETVVEDDGLTFLGDSVTADRIRDDAEYLGVRVTLEARLGAARIPLQVDVGFGDAIVPPPQEVSFPVLLDQPAPRLRAYRRETVVAEKLQAMVDLGIANSRMKDFFDLQFLSDAFPFDGTELVAAIEATFRRRGFAAPSEPPLALTEAFWEDEAKRTQWAAFVRKGRLRSTTGTLREAGLALRSFLLPPLQATASGVRFGKTWTPGGPWEGR